MFALLQNLVTRTRDLRDGRHGEQRGEREALRPYSCLHELLRKRHWLGVDVGEDGAHGSDPSEKKQRRCQHAEREREGC